MGGTGGSGGGGAEGFGFNHCPLHLRIAEGEVHLLDHGQLLALYLLHLGQGLVIIQTVHLHRVVNRKAVDNNLSPVKLKLLVTIKLVLVWVRY